MPTPHWRAPSLLFLALGLALGLAIFLTAGPAWCADRDITTRRVPFKPGAHSAVVAGTIKGRQTIDYLVTARQGQHANISLATRHGATTFNLLAPGQSEVAFFIGSLGQNQFEGVLPEDGPYRIRVYMMRSAARRQEVAPFRLEVVLGPPHRP